MRKPIEFRDHRFAPFTYRYPAVVKHIEDGDTVDVYADLGLYNYAYEPLRLAAFDAPEKDAQLAAEREHAEEAITFLGLLLIDKQVRVHTYKTRTGGERQSFERFVADVWYYDEAHALHSVAETMRAAGYARRASYTTTTP